MASSQRSVVVAHCVQLVFGAWLHIRFYRFDQSIHILSCEVGFREGRTDNVLFQIEGEWVVNQTRHFRFGSIPFISFLSEPFQMNNEYPRCFVNPHLLHRLFMFFTLRTVPLVPRLQLLLLLKLFETLVESETQILIITLFFVSVCRIIIIELFKHLGVVFSYPHFKLIPTFRREFG